MAEEVEHAPVDIQDSLLDAAEEIGGQLEALFEVAGTKDSGEARISMCLCLTIAELYIAVLAVARSRAQGHVPVLIRSMHEALADMKNLVADPTYLRQMHFDNADQALKTFKGFIEDVELAKDAEAQKSLAEWTAKEQKVFEEGKAVGLTGLGVAGKFKRAGMAGEYATGYRFLCSFAHSDLNTLKARHAGSGHLRFTDPLPLETLKSTLTLAVSIYARAVETMPAYTDLAESDAKAAIDKANAIWEKARSAVK